MKMKKRALSIVLTLAMLVTMVPMMGVTANGEDSGSIEPSKQVTSYELVNNPVCSISSSANASIMNKQYNTLAEAIQAADQTTTIELLSDVNENITTEYREYESVGITEIRKITINLNGHVIKGTGQGSVITNTGRLVINGINTSNASTKISHYFTDEKCLHGVKIGNECTDCNGTAEKDGCYETIFEGDGVPEGIEDVDYIKVVGGCITGGNAEYGGGINNNNQGPTTLYLNHVNIVGNTATYGGGVFCDGKDSCIDLNGGTIIHNCADEGGGVYLNKGSLHFGDKSIIKNNMAKNLNKKNIVLTNYSAVRVSITNFSDEGTEIHMSSKADVFFASASVNDDFGVKCSKYVFSDIDGYTYIFVPVTGGQSARLKCEVKKTCRVGSTKYDTIEAALKGATGNANTVPENESETNPTIIVLQQDVTENITIPSNRHIKLDLNSYKLTATDNAKPLIDNNGTLTITDSVGGGSIIGGTMAINQNGSLTLDGKANVTNIYLPKDKKITVASSYSGESTVSIQNPNNDNPVEITGINSQDFSGKIKSTDESKYHAYNSGNDNNQIVKFAKVDTSWYTDTSETTDAKEYILKDAADLEGLAYLTQNLNYGFRNKTIKLAPNYDNTVPLTVPIGTWQKQFQGRFDGNGRTVKLAINSPGTDYTGLFGYVGPYGWIINASTEGSVEGKENVGGVAGYSNNNVKNCSSTVKVQGNTNVGGIVGKSDASVENCFYFEGTVSGTTTVGGIVGLGNAKNCYSTGTVSGNEKVGEIAGKTSSVSYCYFLEKSSNSISVIGEGGSAQFSISLSQDQMKAKEGETNSNWKSITVGNKSGRLSLVDALNACVDNTPDNELKYWGVASGYPNFNNGFYLSSIDIINKTISEIGNGEEVVINLKSNISGNVVIPDGKIVLIDLRGHTITASDAEKTVIDNNGTLTITDSVGGGKVTGGTYGVDQKGSLTLAGGADINNIFLPEGKTIKVEASYNGSSSVSTAVTPTDGNPVPITDASSEDFSGKITSNNPNNSKTYNTGTGNNQQVKLKLIDTSWYYDHNETHGSTTNPFIIENIAQLEGLAYLVNNGKDAFIESSSVEESEAETEEEEEYQGEPKVVMLSDAFASREPLTTPIGNSDNPFCGVFYGNGKTVELCINEPEADNVGMFGYANGFVYVINVYTTGSVVGKDYVGGVVGYAAKDTIMNCASTAAVKGSRYVGGIVGFHKNQKMKVSNCYVTGDVSGSSYVGRIAGHGGVENCYYLFKETDEKITGDNDEVISSYALSEEQMKAAAGSDNNDGWTAIKVGENDLGKVALVDALNMYVKNSAGVLSYWYVSGGFPQFNKKCKIGEEEYDSIEGAISSIKTNEQTTITIYGIFWESITIPDNKNIIIDLNGGGIVSSGVAITNNGTLTITSTIGGGGVIGGEKGIDQNGILTLDGCVDVDNVYLHEGKTINAGESPNVYASVSTEVVPTYGKPIDLANTAPEGFHLISDNPSHKVYESGTGDSKKLILSVHEHTWNYSVGTTTTTNDTLKAYCSETFGTTHCSSNTEAKAQKVTIIKPALTTYGETGSEKATLSAPSLGALTFAENSIKYIEISGTEYSENTTAPTAAGKYKASITVGNGEDAKTAYVEYTIAAAPSTITTPPTAVSNLTYNATTQNLITGGQAQNGTMKYALGENGSTAPSDGWSGSIPTGKDAKTYYVWYKSEGNTNYSDTTPVCIEVKIGQKEITVAAGTYKVSKEYDGTATAGNQVSDTALTISDIAEADKSTVSVVAGTIPAYSAKTAGSSYSLDLPISINGDSNNNYKIKDGATTITVPGEITQKSIVVASGITATNRGYISNDTSVELVVTNAVLNGKVGSDDLSVTTTGSMENDSAGASKKVNISNYILTGTDAGNYILSETGHQSETTVDISAAPSTITTTPTAVSNLSYDKDNPQPQPLINAGEVEHGTIYYALGDNSTNAPTEEGAWSTDVPTATDAGTYYVWYKVVGEENYADTTPTCITVKISSEKDCWLLNLIKKIFSCKCLTTISTRLIDRFNSIFKNIFK